MPEPRVLDELIDARNTAHLSAASTIPLDVVDRFLTALAQSSNTSTPSAASPGVALETYKARLNGWLEQYKLSGQLQVENFKAVTTFGQSALRAVLIVSGLAATALLTFLGQALGSPTLRPHASELSPALRCVGLAVLLSTACFGIAYLTQWCYAQDHQKFGHALNVLNILIAIVAYSLIFSALMICAAAVEVMATAT